MKANGQATARRPIEGEYLATLNAGVPLDAGKAICQRATDDAKARADAAKADVEGMILGTKPGEWTAKADSMTVTPDRTPLLPSFLAKLRSVSDK